MHLIEEGQVTTRRMREDIQYHITQQAGPFTAKGGLPDGIPLIRMSALQMIS